MDFASFEQRDSELPWRDGTVVRHYTYSHSQPQWADVLAHPESPPDASDDPPVTRAPPLPPPRRCRTCAQAKQLCTCTDCTVCRCAVGRGTRHHCRKCWRAVCAACWVKVRYVHMLGRPMQVCDRCAVPWGLANLCKREERGLYWGLYLLRRAGEMPSMCVAAKCHTFTYYPVCYACGTATVMTQPHYERLVRVDTSRVDNWDKVRVLDATAHSLREAQVDSMSADEVHDTFRRCFHHYEEVLSFRGVLSALEAQDILLGMVAATVSYEYHSAPNLTLSLSDVPYAKLLKIQCAKPRYTIFEAPGKVKFVAFPGTHNWRTRWADLRFSPELRQVWAPVVEGVRLDSDTGEAVPVCGGVRKVWEYKVHAGFSQEARDVGLPMEELVEDVRNGYRLVFAGHSLGGCVAQLLTIQMLARYPNEFPMPDSDDYRVGADKDSHGDAISSRRTGKILCVTLGAPLLGNYQLVERVEGSGWAGRFHHIVYRTDIVPRLSCGDELTWDATSQLMERMSGALRQVQGWFTRSGGDSGSVSGAVSPGAPAPLAPPPPPSAPAEGGGVALAAALASVATSTVTSAVRGVVDSKSVAAGGDGHGSIELPASVVNGDPPGTLETFVDSTIRRGRDVLEEAATAVRGAAGRNAGEGEGPSGARAHVASDQLVSGERPEPDAEEDVSSIVAQIKKGEVTSASNRVHRRFACFGRYHFLAFGEHGYVSTTDSEMAFGMLKRGCGEATILLDHSVASYNRSVMLHLYGGAKK